MSTAASSPRAHLSCLGVNNGVPSLRSPDEVRVLLLEFLEVLLGLPIPDRVAGKYQIHLLQRSLVRLRVESPDDDDAENIDSPEDVQRLLVELLEYRGE